jgi:hypothetical protein
LRAPGEPIYVFAGAIPAWAWYSTDWASPDTARLRYLSGIARSGGPAFENAPAWPGEAAGTGLRHVTPEGLELYGASTGLEAHVYGLKHASPDPRWAPSEARRIIAEARPGIWLLFAHFYGPEGVLLDRLDAAGGRRVFQDTRNGAALIHYRFPS